MRLAYVIDAPPAAARRGGTALDAERLADRLSEGDMRFHVEWLPPESSLLPRLADELGSKKGQLLVFFSGVAKVHGSGVALCAGRKRKAIAEVKALAEALSAFDGEALLVLDLVHPVDDDDPTASVTLVDAVRAAVDGKRTGVAALVGAEPERDGRRRSPFVASLLAALERARSEASKTGAVSAARVVEVMRAEPETFHAIAASGYFRAERELMLLLEHSVVIGDPASIPPLAAAEEKPWSAGDELRARGQHAQALDQYKRALLSLGTKSPERAEVYLRIGMAKRALGSAAEAIHNFDKALSIDPAHAGALSAAAELLLEAGEHRRLEELYRRRLAVATSDDDRIRQLEAIARLWLGANDGARASVSALEQWLALREDEKALELLVEAEDAGGRIERRVAARERLGRTAQRAHVLVDAARLAREHLPGGAEAVALSKLALEIDPSALAALEIAAQVLGAARRWRELAELYQGVIERIDDPGLGWDLAKKLGVLRRDELNDAEGARVAFDHAASLDAADPEPHVWLAELARDRSDWADAARERRIAAALAPRDAEQLQSALEDLSKAGDADGAWCVAMVLDHLGAADINESLLADTHRPDGLITARAVLREQGWEALWPERDAALTRLLETCGPPLVAARARSLRERGQLPRLEADTRQDPRGTTTLARSAHWTARLLGMELPAVHLVDVAAGGIAALPTDDPALLVARAMGSGYGLSELAFVWARALALLRPERAVATLYPTVPELAAVVLAALALAGVTDPSDLDGATAELAEELESALSADQQAALSDVAKSFELRGIRGRIGAWLEGACLSASRAGVLACGDVALAVGMISRHPLPGIELERQQDDALGFFMSAEHSALRRQLGVAIAS